MGQGKKAFFAFSALFCCCSFFFFFFLRLCARLFLPLSLIVSTNT